jgi:hypothetical protein
VALGQRWPSKVVRVVNSVREALREWRLGRCLLEIVVCLVGTSGHTDAVLFEGIKRMEAALPSQFSGHK